MRENMQPQAMGTFQQLLFSFPERVRKISVLDSMEEFIRFFQENDNSVKYSQCNALPSYVL
jgi:hypothetical protein